MADVLCKTNVKDGLTVRKCGLKLPTYLVGKVRVPGRCDNVSNHMLPFRSGFCSNGWHEGDNPKDFQGTPVPSCKLWMQCPCECHVKWDKLYALGEMERILVDNSTYHPNLGEFSMPSPEERALAYAKTHAPKTSEPVLVPSHAPGVVPPTLSRDFAQTPSGRAARGELEAWVRKACDDWLVDQPPVACTPVYVADDIAREQGINPPSTGAITAVLDRWVKIGFAVVERKPVRFINYTPEGIEQGLEVLKLKSKGKTVTPGQLASRRIDA